MQVDRWYDVTCGYCGRHLSTDYEAGLQPTRKRAELVAKQYGFATMQGRNICPACKAEVKSSANKENNRR